MFQVETQTLTEYREDEKTASVQLQNGTSTMCDKHKEPLTPVKVYI